MVTDPRRAGPRQDEGSFGADDAETPLPARLHTNRGAGLPPVPSVPPLPSSDEELFALYARTESDRAFREIVLRYQPKILRYFLRNAATRSRAEDLTQEVFIRIIRNRRSYDPKLKFATWSKTIAERIAINAARSATRSRVTTFADLGEEADEEDTDGMDLVDSEPLPDARVESGELRARLGDALAQVDERYREPAVLHFLQGLTHTESARRLQIPVGTAKSRTHRALKDLRRILGDQGLAPA